jgi:hypothetical protein
VRRGSLGGSKKVEMRSSVVTIVVLFLVGCGNPLEVIGRHNYDVVILAKEPVVLREEPVVFRSERPMQVVGEYSMVCLVLRGGVSSRDANDALFKEALDDAKVGISIKLTSGKTHQLSEPMKGWSLFGRIKSRELLACSSDCCDDRISIGDQVEEVTVQSSKPLTVEGIYWESTDAFDGLGKNR